MVGDVSSLEARPIAYKEVPDHPGLASSKHTVILVCCCAAIGVGFWASFAKLDSATEAPGELRVESHRKELKVLDSGVVRKLLVKEGDHVDAGQLLIEIDPTRIDARVDNIRLRLASTRARLARYKSIISGDAAIQFPKDLMTKYHLPQVRKAIDIETDLFETEIQALKTRRNLMQNRILQLQTNISATEGRQGATRQQMALIADELVSVEFLLGKELIPRSRYLSVKRQAVELEARLNELISLKAQLSQAVGAAEIELLDLDEKARNEALIKIAEAQDLINQLQEETTTARNSQELHSVRAPQSGTIFNLAVYGESTVVLAGEALMEILPDSDRIIVDAQVSTNEIDNIAVGMKAKVRLKAFNARKIPMIDGRVILIKADSLLVEGEREKSYGASIVLDKESVENLGDVELTPGMQATVMIINGERTVIDYLLSPLTVAFETSMTEE